MIENPLGPGETVVGLNLLDMDLTIYGQYTWARFDLRYKKHFVNIQYYMYMV